MRGERREFVEVIFREIAVANDLEIEVREIAEERVHSLLKVLQEMGSTSFLVETFQDHRPYSSSTIISRRN